jgi:hypothetical protein
MCPKGVSYLLKFAFKTCMSMIFKMIVYKVFSLIPKKGEIYLSNPNSYFMCANKSPCWDHNVLLKTYFIVKTSSLSVLKHSAKFYKPYKVGLKQFEAYLQKLQKK